MIGFILLKAGYPLFVSLYVTNYKCSQYGSSFLEPIIEQSNWRILAKFVSYWAYFLEFNVCIFKLNTETIFE